MRYFEFFSLLLCTSVIISCTSPKDEVIGHYVGTFKSNQDSLKINEGGFYERSVYVNGNKVFTNKGRYEVRNGSVVFHDFLFYRDDISSAYNYSSEHLMNCTLNYEWGLTGFKLYVDYDQDYYYVKQSR